ncbi:hypothetical protein BGZ49_010212, partial [Haplosporangium sp. Z 27]
TYKVKQTDAISEVVSNTPVLNLLEFSSLLKEFVDVIKHFALFEIHLLDGMATLMRNTPPGYIDSDDVVKAWSISAHD